ncbi:hypothetical protein PG996_013520 [Apiospora saccharicola]|uniref:F-box domain-containing protein n=1 Tax=Apiospora saccharicola TaxID=335842 RepID=A0ABR1U5P2_9PEZI
MSPILNLPRELSQQIIGQLPFLDKVRLSATCKEYRAYLIPEIFATIRFTSKEKSANAALVAVKAHGEHTTCIDFTCKAYDDERSISPLPSAAAEVLAGHHMPNLHATRLDFDFDFSTYDDCWDVDIGILAQSVEDPRHTRAVELLNWRAKENESWQALSMNQHITALTVDHFNPATEFAFDSGEALNFLGRLESATLSIREMVEEEDLCDYNDDCIPLAYLDFFRSDLYSRVLQHMHNLKHLEICAPDLCPTGVDSQYHIGVGLSPRSLPALQSLKLVNGVISEELVSFIRHHARSLTSLNIEKCVASTDYDDAGCMSWAKFFNQVYETDPVLVQLIVGGIKLPWIAKDDISSYYDRREARIIQEARCQLESQPSLKVFGYSYIYDYHIFSREYRQCAIEFRAGHDQRAYERLMGLVNTNAARVRDN